MSKATKLKLSELTPAQKQALTYRLDSNTGYGYLTISAAVHGQWGDMSVVECCEKFEMSPLRAKIHARKIANFDSKEQAKTQKKTTAIAESFSKFFRQLQDAVGENFGETKKKSN